MVDPDYLLLYAVKIILGFNIKQGCQISLTYIYMLLIYKKVII